MSELSHGTLGDVDVARTHGADPPRTGSSGEEEFRALFEASYQDLVRTLCFVLSDRAVAQEIAQDAFVELYRRWGTVADYERPDRSSSVRPLAARSTAPTAR